MEAAPYIALLIGCCVIYAQTLGFEFIPTWDDGNLVIRNSRIRGLTLTHLAALFGKPVDITYDPLHIMSFSLEYALWGLNPAGYHLTNMVLHGVNACLLYAVVRGITGSGTASLLASMLFAVHPLNVENVAWVSERKTLLSTFFLLLSLRLYLVFTARKFSRLYAGSLVCFILAILSKPTAVILPLVLLAYEAVLGTAGISWRRPAAFFVTAAAGVFVTVWTYHQSGIIGSQAMSGELLLGTVYPTMFSIYGKYLLLLVLPVNLSGYYDTVLYHSFLDPAVLPVIAGTVIAIGLLLWKGNGQVRFWCLWGVLSFLPVSGIIPLETVFYADRYMYMPAIGLFVLFSLGVVHYRKIARGFSGRIQKTGAVVIPVAICLIAVYAYAAYARTSVWHDEVTFWTDTVSKSPGMYKAHLNLGVAYENRGFYREAESEYLKAVGIYPEWRAVDNLKMVRAKMKYGYK